MVSHLLGLSLKIMPWHFKITLFHLNLYAYSYYMSFPWKILSFPTKPLENSIESKCATQWRNSVVRIRWYFPLRIGYRSNSFSAVDFLHLFALPSQPPKFGANVFCLNNDLRRLCTKTRHSLELNWLTNHNFIAPPHPPPISLHTRASMHITTVPPNLLITAAWSLIECARVKNIEHDFSLVKHSFINFQAWGEGGEGCSPLWMHITFLLRS